MSGKHIMLIEDDQSISRMLGPYMEKEGYLITYAYDGMEAERLFAAEPAKYSLVILDLMLPYKSGLEVLRAIRSMSLVPVLILSAKDNEADKALALELGADDYVTKPFSLIELTARVRAVIRRSNYMVSLGQAAVSLERDEVIRVGGIVINLETYDVQRDGQPVKLTSTEFGILRLLAKQPGRVYTKAQIYASVWNNTFYGDDNIINVHMRRLREKLEANPSDPQYIKTLWGLGYKLEADWP
ncbi:response regulator transcription factor [Paenibacillus sp. JX-17]|uniref:Response regulator transcription factor n=1 Tax=Paenibacillus lacisoli TaxID=3064525 RepID=A0ABT9C6B6_9BACL|nr:response regulator transcription factor [Paenibacillus sp. JX-17]MDO7904804.1 response regulator transcription factor [Paenibacillus sp. JX-17]